MPHIDTILGPTAELLADRPICERCDTPMWLVHITPVGPNAAERTFACPNCDLIPGKHGDGFTDD